LIIAGNGATQLRDLLNYPRLRCLRCLRCLLLLVEPFQGSKENKIIKIPTWEEYVIDTPKKCSLIDINISVCYSSHSVNVIAK